MVDDPADLKRARLECADDIQSPAFDPHTEVADALRAIVDEVEAHGPGGHWLSRDSHLVARARIALAATGEARPYAHPREIVASGSTKKDEQ